MPGQIVCDDIASDARQRCADRYRYAMWWWMQKLQSKL